MHVFELYYRDILKDVPSKFKSDMLANSEFVNIDNVAEYFYVAEKEHWDVELDFPCVAPPWPFAWMEFQMPEAYLLEHGFPPKQQINFGATIASIEFAPDKGHEALRSDILMHMAEQATRHYTNPEFRTIREPGWESKVQQIIDRGLTAKWETLISIYSTHNNEIRPFFTAILYLDAQGAILPNLHRYSVTSAFSQWSSTPGDMSPVLPFLYALQFLHCKNVEMIKAPSPRSIRRRMKKRGAPDIIFKQLIVHVMGAKRIPEDDPEHMLTGIKQRLHICRGHFKDYRQGKGLFGRIRGIFWWAQQARGSLEKGIVLKDYKLDTDQ